MVKRTLTMNAVSSAVQVGKPAASSGSTASCDDPAYTKIVMPMACGMVSTDLLIATPVTSPQASTGGIDGI